MCDFCDVYGDKYDIPSLGFSVSYSRYTDSDMMYDCYINSSENPPVLCVAASYSDTEEDVDRVQIPLRYCPVCGAAL